MLNKYLGFLGVSLTVTGMLLIVYASENTLISAAGLVIGIAGMLGLNYSHYKVLRRLKKVDKNYFKQSL